MASRHWTCQWIQKNVKSSTGVGFRHGGWSEPGRVTDPDCLDKKTDFPEDTRITLWKGCGYDKKN